MEVVRGVVLLGVLVGDVVAAQREGPTIEIAAQQRVQQRAGTVGLVTRWRRAPQMER